MNRLRKLLQSKFVSGSSFFVASVMTANVLNFLFNAYVGRSLTLSQFALVTFINTIAYVLNIVLAAISATVVHRVAFLNTQRGAKAATLEFRKLQQFIFQQAIIGTIVFLIIAPVMTRLFYLQTVTTLLAMSPAIVASAMGIMNRAYLQGRLLFFYVGLLVILEPVLKLVISFALIQFRLFDFVYIAIPAAGVGAALVAIAFVQMLSREFSFKADEIEKPTRFPHVFFSAALITGLANNLFLTFDVLLVKHFFSPTNAGVYSLLSLVGKMIYFFGSILTAFMLPLVSADLGAKRNPARTFEKLFALTVLTVIICVTGMLSLGPLFLPLAFGEKVQVIFPYIPYYAVAIGAYTISSALLLYHLARKHYTFSAVSILISLLLCVGIILFHANIGEVVTVMLYLSIANLISLLILHIIHSRGVQMMRTGIDLLCLFLPLPPTVPSKKGGKRILIFNWRDTRHAYAGGAEVYIHELAQRWVEKGHTVTLFCGNDQKSRRYEDVDGVHVIRRGGFYIVYIWAFFYYLFRLRGNYDVILDCENGIPFFTPLFAKEKIYAVMFHVHQKVFRESLIWPLSFIASYLEANVMPWAYRNVEFITISPSTKKDMEKVGLGKAGIHIVYPGVDTAFLNPGEKEKKPIVLDVARLKKYKSIDLLIRAMKLVRKKVKNVQCVIAGDGEERAKLKDLARRIGVDDIMTFKGKVTQEEKRDLYQKAWVFANPSMMEGWAITNIEASASGTAVVAANVPGMRDSVKHAETGLLFEYGNIQEFADRIVQVLQNAKLRQRLEDNSVGWARRFEWNKSAEKCLAIMFTQ